MALCDDLLAPPEFPEAAATSLPRHARGERLLDSLLVGICSDLPDVVLPTSRP